MDLPAEAVEEFKKIYESKFKEKLTDGEYKIRAESFLNLFDLITKPTPKKDGNKTE